MNKEDILAKSREENHGSDEYEKAVLQKAGQLAAQVGMLICCAVAVTSVAVTGRVNAACWMIYFSIYTTIFATKYRHLKKRHELMMTVISAAVFLLFTVLFIREMILWN